MRTARRHLALSLLCALAGTQPAASQPGASGPAAEGESLLRALPAAVAARLERDRVALTQDFGEGGEVYGGTIRALVIFDVPVERAHELLVQAHRQTEWQPDLSRIETVLSEEAESVHRFEMKMMFMTFDYHLRFAWDAEHGRVQWALDPERESSFDVVEGSWELLPLGEARTLGRFATRIDLGPGLPGWLQDYASRRAVPGTLERCRRWVDSGGAWRP